MQEYFGFCLATLLVWSTDPESPLIPQTENIISLIPLYYIRGEGCAGANSRCNFLRDLRQKQNKKENAITRPISISPAFCCSNIPRLPAACSAIAGMPLADMHEASDLSAVSLTLSRPARAFKRGFRGRRTTAVKCNGNLCPPLLRPFRPLIHSPFRTDSPSPPRRPWSRWSRRGRARSCCSD